MSIWKSLTQQKWPLEDHHDALARVGLRYLLCTGPYFLFLALVSAFGSHWADDHWGDIQFATVWIALVPLLGYVIDVSRLKKGDAGRSSTLRTRGDAS